MPQTVNLEAIVALPLDERIALVQAVWDSIAAETDPVQLTEPQERELDRRIAELDANPQDARLWEEIKKEFKANVRGRK